MKADRGSGAGVAVLCLLVCGLPACSTFFANPHVILRTLGVVPTSHVNLRTREEAGLLRVAALSTVCLWTDLPGKQYRRRELLMHARVVAMSQSAQDGDAVPDDVDEQELQREAQAFFQAPGLTTRDIASMTVPQLKDELRERGLKVGGTKGELLQRLQDAMDGKIATQALPIKTSRVAPRAASSVVAGPRAASSEAASVSSRKAGGGIKLAEGERLPVAPAMPKRSLDASVRRIFVRGIPFRATPRDVALTLEDAFGPVTKLEGMTIDGRATGRAWVTFENAEIAKAAVEEARIEMDNRPIFFSPPWSLAARQALREMAEIATYESGGVGGAMGAAGMPPPPQQQQQQLARDGRPMSADGGATRARSEAAEADETDEMEGGGRTLFLGRVPMDADEEAVRRGLAEIGEVERVFMGRINQNKPSSDFAGYAHAVMKDAAAVARAISTPIFINGERVRADRAADGPKEMREERFPLDQQYHGSLIGVAGRTVAELERRSGARITFELNPQPCMVAKGSAGERRAAWQAAQQAMAALGSESVEVPRKLWSVLIGAGGSNIRRIESESGARLQLDEEPQPHLKVQGMPDARKAAKALVRALMDREEEELFAVPAKFHGLLVGKRGMTVKELQADSGAFISFVKQPEPGMLVKGLLHQRDRAWGITERVIEELPVVLAEMRGIDKAAAMLELDATFGQAGSKTLNRATRATDNNADDAEVNPRSDEVWEEVVARALERAKTLYKESKLQQKRRERGSM